MNSDKHVVNTTHPDNSSSKYSNINQTNEDSNQNCNVNQNSNNNDIPEDILDDLNIDNDKSDKKDNAIDDIDNNNEDFLESIINETTDDYKFDSFVEKLQEIVIEDQFNQMQLDFMDKYYTEFEEKKENKLIYTSIFNEYTSMTESYIEKNLQERVPQYKLEDFYKMLETRKAQIDDQILDTLLSFTDFQMFKEMMLDYKARKSNKEELFSGIMIQKAGDNSQIKSFDNFDYLNEEQRKKHPGFNKKK